MSPTPANARLLELVAEAERVSRKRVSLGFSLTGHWYVSCPGLSVRDGEMLHSIPCHADTPQAALRAFIDQVTVALIDRTLETL